MTTIGLDKLYYAPITESATTGKKRMEHQPCLQKQSQLNCQWNLPKQLYTLTMVHRKL